MSVKKARPALPQKRPLVRSDWAKGEKVRALYWVQHRARVSTNATEAAPPKLLDGGSCWRRGATAPYIDHDPPPVAADLAMQSPIKPHIADWFYTRIAQRRCKPAIQFIDTDANNCGTCNCTRTSRGNDAG
jgi:hypothetical protein